MDVRWKINVGSRTNLTNNKFTVFSQKENESQIIKQIQ